MTTEDVAATPAQSPLALTGTPTALEALPDLIEVLPIAIYACDVQGRVLWFNSRAAEIWGRRPRLAGQPEKYTGAHRVYFDGQEMPRDATAMASVLKTGVPIRAFESQLERPDGTRVWVTTHVEPVKDDDGRLRGAISCFHESTSSHEVTETLRESERRLHELLAAIPAAIYTTDAAGKVTYYNEAAVELAGRRPTIGSDHWCVTWKMYWPDGSPLPHDQSPMAVALREGRPIRGKEAVAERPDGTRVPFIPFPTPLRDASGKIVGAINMLIDVSERRQAESQQRVLLRELNHRVKNNMQMLQSLLYAATRQTQNEEARKVLEDAAGRISAMAAAQRVLYSTTDATRFSAGEFIDAVCQSVQQTFPSEVKIVCEAASGELDNDDAMPLALILNELLTNAAKHSGDGKGEKLIRVGLTNEGAMRHLYVEDGGPGFDLQSVTNRASGLKLVQLLARQLRGRFEVSRNPVTRCSLHFS
jgi:PAS domain S-box-containing protein